jgi:hypothetical protein
MNELREDIQLITKSSKTKIIKFFPFYFLCNLVDLIRSLIMRELKIRNQNFKRIKN